MDRSLVALLASIALLGCHTDSETPPPEEEIVRPISSALRDQCPGSVLARSAEALAPARPVTGIESVPTMRLAQSNSVIDSIHDQKGKLVSVFSAPISWSIDGPLYIPWDGKILAGGHAAPGNYFHFVEFRDTANQLIRRDSACMLLDNGT